MADNHIKRLAMPKSWPMSRKSARWITKPNPGTHNLQSVLALGTIIRDLLGYAKTMAEVKHILNKREVFVNNIRRKDQRFPVGVFDTLAIPEINETYRMTMNHNGKLMIIKIPKDETKHRILRITGKHLYAGKTQLAFSDGTTMLVGKEKYATGDSVVISDKKITEHLPLEKGVTIFLTGGAHISSIGTVESIEKDNVKFKSEKDVYVTPQRYAFVLGKGKALITTHGKQ